MFFFVYSYDASTKLQCYQLLGCFCNNTRQHLAIFVALCIEQYKLCNQCVELLNVASWSLFLKLLQNLRLNFKHVLESKSSWKHRKKH